MLVFIYFIISNIQLTRGVLDPTLTLISEWGRLEEPHLPTKIRCLSVHHRPEDIQFSRVLNTGQDSQLPTNKEIVTDSDFFGVESRLLILHPSTDPAKDRRFGAFSCSVSTHNVTTTVTTLKLPAYDVAEVIPRAVYVSAHVNESVSFHMEKRAEGGKLVWRHRGQRQTKGIDSVVYDVGRVKARDAGIYELFYENRRKFGRHGMTRLVVMKCPYGFYGDDCLQTCPPCLNGGVCHESNGQCLCPPGFGGPHCQHPCGFNHFGPTCSWTCGDAGEGCQRLLVCLADPYSCSCISGFMGPDCTRQCPAGRFGANCLQACRCRHADDVCDGVTGYCQRGCQEGWAGESCQIPALDPVQRVQFWNLDDPSSTRITWDPVQSEIHGHVTYKVEYRVLRKEGCEDSISKSPWQQRLTLEPELTLRHLQPYSVYEIAIVANSSYGSGESFGGTWLTDTGLPTGSPRDVVATQIEASALSFSWKSPHCGESNGAIVSYDTELWPLPEGSHGSNDLSNSKSVSWTILQQSDSKPISGTIVHPSVRVEGLPAYRYYAFRVRARTSAGPGSWSKELVAMTEWSVAPPPQLMLIDSTAMSLSVGIICADIPSHLVRQIQLQMWIKVEHSPNAIEAEFDANPDFLIHNYTFTKLQPFTGHLVRARVSTAKGWGNWSLVQDYATDESYPSVPSVSLLYAAVDHLVLQIKPPEPANGIIHKYRIRVAGPRISGQTPSIPTVPAPERISVLNYTVRHLVAATRYQVQVQASTGLGWGNWSEPFDAWTTEGVPEAPSSLKLVKSNSSSLHVKWSRPAKVHGTVVGYEITCSAQFTFNSSITIDQIRNKTLRVDGHTHDIVFGQLEPFTKYNIRVRARNKFHRGHYVNKAFMTALASPPPLECFSTGATETTIPVHINLMQTPQQFLTLYQIIVESGESISDENLLMDYDEALKSELDYYVSLQVNQSEFSSLGGLLIYIGDSRYYDSYWNAPLKSSTEYRFRVRVVVFDGKQNYSSIADQTCQAATQVVQTPAAQHARPACSVFDPECFWFPFVIVGCALLIIWLVSSVVIYKCWFSKLVSDNIPLPPEKEQGSSASFAWSVDYRKGPMAPTHSEASTLVKDHNTLL